MLEYRYIEHGVTTCIGVGTQRPGSRTQILITVQYYKSKCGLFVCMAYKNRSQRGRKIVREECLRRGLPMDEMQKNQRPHIKGDHQWH